MNNHFSYVICLDYYLELEIQNKFWLNLDSVYYKNANNIVNLFYPSRNNISWFIIASFD